MSFVNSRSSVFGTLLRLSRVFLFTVFYVETKECGSVVVVVVGIGTGIP